MKAEEPRYNLNGEIVGEVTTSEAHYAQLKLNNKNSGFVLDRLFFTLVLIPKSYLKVIKCHYRLRGYSKKNLKYVARFNLRSLFSGESSRSFVMPTIHYIVGQIVLPVKVLQ